MEDHDGTTESYPLVDLVLAECHSVFYYTTKKCTDASVYTYCSELAVLFLSQEKRNVLELCAALAGMSPAQSHAPEAFYLNMDQTDSGMGQADPFSRKIARC